MAAVLSLENIIAGYGDVAIVHGISASVDKGEIVAIVGPNGSGKSTLLKSVFGFAKLLGGKIVYQGNDVTGMASDRLVKIGIGYVPQVNNVFPNLTIAENLEMGAYLHRTRDAVKAAMREVYEMFSELDARKSSLAGNLSGGERQMVAIARAMATHPKVLLLDEPLASLSPKPIAVIIDKLKEIGQKGTAIMMVEQNVKTALSVAKRGYVLVDGTCVLQGEAGTLFTEATARQRFVGLGPADRP
jgi:branched-chain amino acid transport system ATP-binding protein